MRAILLTGLLALLLAPGFAGCASPEGGPAASEVRIEAAPDRGFCEAGGGRWEMFPNQCRDFCPYRRGERSDCVQRRAMGCYCPGFRCWDGQACVPL